jgi:hypothetical protein
MSRPSKRFWRWCEVLIPAWTIAVLALLVYHQVTYFQQTIVGSAKPAPVFVLDLAVPDVIDDVVPIKYLPCVRHPSEPTK